MTPGLLSCFVTGTDTEVGKTFATCALLRAHVQQGARAVGMKPVAAGARWAEGRWQNDDVERIADAGNVEVPREILCPFLLRDAVAPHIAAQTQGRRIVLAPILAAFDHLRASADVVIVEGVGGFRVPLDETFDSADLAVRLALPIVLVVGLRLGCLNHAALTAESIRARGLRLAGWIANAIDPAMAQADRNFLTLERLLDAPCLGRLPWIEPERAHMEGGQVRTAEFDRAASHLRLDAATAL